MLKPIVGEELFIIVQIIVLHTSARSCWGMMSGFFQVHLRKRLTSETANHEMIAKPEIVLPVKNETPSFARLMVEELLITDTLPIPFEQHAYTLFDFHFVSPTERMEFRNIY